MIYILSTLIVAAVVIAALLIGSRSKANSALKEECLHLKMLLERENNESQKLRDRLAQSELKNAELSTRNELFIERLNDQKTSFDTMRKQMSNEFKVMASSILEEKSRHFTELNRDNLDRILTPLQQRITEFKSKVEESYDKESKERFSLDSRIRELIELNQRISQEANNLTKALKGDSKIQGDWGEMILESILEKSGLVKGREYFTQETLQNEMGKSLVTDEGRRLRPDVVVVYPDQRRVVIDSKVSLTAYARYMEAESKEASEKALQEHIRSLKNHVDELATKGYQDYVESLDFVMMFVPNEPAYLTAMQYDNNLWHYAYAKRVMLISPTNLIAALKLVADLWKREKQSQNAIDIAERGAALYDKFVGFLGALSDIGVNLERTTKSYTQAMNQLKDGRGNLIGQVEKLRTLGVKAKKEIPSALLSESDSEN